jgi:hypothetical protein
VIIVQYFGAEIVSQQTIGKEFQELHAIGRFYFCSRSRAPPLVRIAISLVQLNHVCDGHIIARSGESGSRVSPSLAAALAALRASNRSIAVLIRVVSNDWNVSEPL